MRETEILRCREARAETAVRVALHLGDLVGHRLVFAAVVLGVPDLPTALGGAPGELELLVRGQAVRIHRDGRTGRTVQRCDLEPSDVAALRLGESDLRAELGRLRGGGSWRCGAERKREQRA